MERRTMGRVYQPLREDCESPREKILSCYENIAPSPYGYCGERCYKKNNPGYKGSTPERTPLQEIPRTIAESEERRPNLAERRGRTIRPLSFEHQQQGSPYGHIQQRSFFTPEDSNTFSFRESDTEQACKEFRSQHTARRQLFKSPSPRKDRRKQSITSQLDGRDDPMGSDEEMADNSSSNSRQENVRELSTKRTHSSEDELEEGEIRSPKRPKKDSRNTSPSRETNENDQDWLSKEEGVRREIVIERIRRTNGGRNTDGNKQEEEERSRGSSTDMEEETDGYDSEGSSGRKSGRCNRLPGTGKQRDESRKNKFYTFVIHKRNCHPNYENAQKTWGKLKPNFYEFDHGDHVHIVYCGKSGSGNASRTRDRISKFYSTTPAGNTEALCSSQLIQNVKRFVIYLLRFGSNTMRLFGRLVEGLEDFSNFIKWVHGTTSIDYVDNNNFKDCKQFIDDKKELEIETRSGKIKKRNLTDIILKQIEDHNILSEQGWENVITDEVKIQMLKEFGTIVEWYVRRLTRIKRTQIVQKLKTSTLFSLLKEVLVQEVGKTPWQWFDENIETLDWIIFLFKSNDISIIEFLAWQEVIKCKRYTKINGMVLEGKTNAGKSLLIEAIWGPTKPEEIPRERDGNSFHLDQLPCSTVALFEEPLITPINVGTWKLMLEGKQIKTDIKHKDKEYIPRTPIVITTATPITNNVDYNEREQIIQRIKLFRFKCSISHRPQDAEAQVSSTHWLLNKPPNYIRSSHFGFIYLALLPQIREHIAILDSENTLAKESIPLDSEVWLASLVGIVGAFKTLVMGHKGLTDEELEQEIVRINMEENENPETEIKTLRETGG